ncbi:SWI/SNF chromatin-remodeling complex subunit [Geranomyces michiganensis]|nr:SWI/SNF chromatin-remodeling complex subunit [Geranomyces michiganensis]
MEQLQPPPYAASGGAVERAAGEPPPPPSLTDSPSPRAPPPAATTSPLASAEPQNLDTALPSSSPLATHIAHIPPSTDGPLDIIGSDTAEHIPPRDEADQVATLDSSHPNNAPDTPLKELMGPSGLSPMGSPSLENGVSPKHSVLPGAVGLPGSASPSAQGSPTKSPAHPHAANSASPTDFLPDFQNWSTAESAGNPTMEVHRASPQSPRLPTDAQLSTQANLTEPALSIPPDQPLTGTHQLLQPPLHPGPQHGTAPSIARPHYTQSSEPAIFGVDVLPGNPNNQTTLVAGGAATGSVNLPTSMASPASNVNASLYPLPGDQFSSYPGAVRNFPPQQKHQIRPNAAMLQHMQTARMQAAVGMQPLYGSSPVPFLRPLPPQHLAQSPHVQSPGSFVSDAQKIGLLHQAVSPHPSLGSPTGVGAIGPVQQHSISDPSQGQTRPPSWQAPMAGTQLQGRQQFASLPIANPASANVAMGARPYIPATGTYSNMQPPSSVSSAYGRPFQPYQPSYTVNALAAHPRPLQPPQSLTADLSDLEPPPVEPAMVVPQTSNNRPQVGLQNAAYQTEEVETGRSGDAMALDTSTMAEPGAAGKAAASLPDSQGFDVNPPPDAERDEADIGGTSHEEIGADNREEVLDSAIKEGGLKGPDFAMENGLSENPSDLMVPPLKSPHNLLEDISIVDNEATSNVMDESADDVRLENDNISDALQKPMGPDVTGENAVEPEIQKGSLSSSREDQAGPSPAATAPFEPPNAPDGTKTVSAKTPEPAAPPQDSLSAGVEPKAAQPADDDIMNDEPPPAPTRPRQSYYELMRQEIAQERLQNEQAPSSQHQGSRPSSTAMEGTQSGRSRSSMGQINPSAYVRHKSSVERTSQHSSPSQQTDRVERMRNLSQNYPQAPQPILQNPFPLQTGQPLAHHGMSMQQQMFPSSVAQAPFSVGLTPIPRPGLQPGAHLQLHAPPAGQMIGLGLSQHGIPLHSVAPNRWIPQQQVAQPQLPMTVNGFPQPSIPPQINPVAYPPSENSLPPTGVTSVRYSAVPVNPRMEQMQQQQHLQPMYQQQQQMHQQQHLHPMQQQQRQQPRPDEMNGLPPDAVPYRDPYIVWEKSLDVYLEREAAYTKAMTQQQARQRALIEAKGREVEYLRGKHRQMVEQSQAPLELFVSRKRKLSEALTFTEQELSEAANQPETLVPIRLDLDVDGVKVRDTFTWNLHDTLVQPAKFAELMCEDLHLPAAFVPAIERAITEQISDYHQHAPWALAAASVDSRGNDGMDLTDSDAPELRTIIKLDITVGNYCLVDQFEWDLSCKRNNPEAFAEHMCNELGLGLEFRTAIAHQVREQVQTFAKSLLLVDHQFDGQPIDDEELSSCFLAPLDRMQVIRTGKDKAIFGPYYNPVSDVEIEKMEKDRERDTRRKRRQTQRSRRAISLPDREFPKTNRTGPLIYNPAETIDPLAAVAPVISTRRNAARKSRAGGLVDNIAPVVAPLPAVPEVPEPPPPLPHETSLIRGWACENCGVGAAATPMIRKNAAGEMMLCDECGLYYARNGAVRPVARSSIESPASPAFSEKARSLHSPSDAGLQPGQEHEIIASAAAAPESSPVPLPAAPAPPAPPATVPGALDLSSLQQVQSPISASPLFISAAPPATGGAAPHHVQGHPMQARIPLPAWLPQCRDALLEIYPDDRFDIVPKGRTGELRLKCLDCPGTHVNYTKPDPMNRSRILRFT